MTYVLRVCAAEREFRNGKHVFVTIVYGGGLKNIRSGKGLQLLDKEHVHSGRERPFIWGDNCDNQSCARAKYKRIY